MASNRTKAALVWLVENGPATTREMMAAVEPDGKAKTWHSMVSNLVRWDKVESVGNGKWRATADALRDKRRPKEFKYCGGCEMTLAACAFSSNAARSDGLEPRCRNCANSYKRAHYKPAPYLGQEVKDWLATQDGPRTVAQMRSIRPDAPARSFYMAISSFVKRGTLTRSYVDGVAHFVLAPKRAQGVAVNPIKQPKKRAEAVAIKSRGLSALVARMKEGKPTPQPQQVPAMTVDEWLAQGGTVERLDGFTVKPFRAIPFNNREVA